MSKSSIIPPDVSDLTTMLLVAETGSLTKAASILGTSQPTVSRSIGRLEKNWGVHLFLRTGRGVVLSESGTQIQPFVRDLVQCLDRLSQKVQAVNHSSSGDVRLGVAPSLNQVIVMPLLRILTETAPGIKLRVYEGSAGQIDQWLIAGVVDIGVTYRNSADLKQGFEHLYVIDSCLVGRLDDPLLAQGSVTVDELDDAPLVLPGKPSSMRVLLDRLAKSHNIALNIFLEAESSHLQAEVAATGMAYAIMPSHLAREFSARRGLGVARFVDLEMQRYIVMGTSTDKPLSLATKEVTRLVRGLSRAVDGGEPEGSSLRSSDDNNDISMRVR